MEYENTAFAFLESDASRKYFAEADFAFRHGRHIQNYGDDTKLWDYVNENFEWLTGYYKHLFEMNLQRETSDREVYFYLDFPEEGRGKFGKDRFKELDEREIVFGILLLNIYKEKFFESKEMRWDDLEQIIEEGENKELWQKLLYGEVKRNYTPNEKEEVKRRIERILWDFNRLGWINWVDSEMFHFEIMPSIDRVAKLYANEINHVELLSDYVNAYLS